MRRVKRMIGGLHAVVLAAGLGSRLAPLTAHRHKCLVRVGGRPILAHTLDTLADAGVVKATLVVGHLSRQVCTAATAWCERLELRIVHNDNPALTGSAWSLALGLATVDPADHVLVIEGDVVFGAQALARLLQADAVDATLVASFEVGMQGSGVVCDADGRVRHWLHVSPRQPVPPPGALKTVNLTRLGCGTVPELREHCRRVPRRAAMENALANLVHAGAWIAAVDVGDAPWCEVDTLPDLLLAEERFPAPVSEGA